LIELVKSQIWRRYLLCMKNLLIILERVVR
jgi:hypothetical protein